MAQIIHDQPQPILFNTELVSVGTASATASLMLPPCGAVRISSGGGTLFFSFIASASSSPGTGMMMLPANSEDIFETQGRHTISLKVDDATTPLTVGITPMVGEPRVQPAVADPDFFLPLADAGSGAVNLALTTGTGGATFSRSTQAAAKLSTGLWKLDVAANVARSHYLGMDTTVGGYAGYLSETAATQLALNPRDMTQAAWAKVTMTTAQTSTGIDGASNSCTRITATGANSTILQTLVAAASSRTYSCWIKRITGTGTIILKQGTATLDITALINSTTFTLVQLNDSELNVAFGIQINTSGDALDVDCNQFEAGAVATTPIPSGGSRAADALSYPVLPNTLPTAGSIYAEMSLLYSTQASVAIVSLAASAATDGLVMASGTATAVSMSDGTNTVTKTGLNTAATAVVKRAGSYGASGMSALGDGVVAATGNFDGAMAQTAIGIGNSGTGATNQMNGTVKNVMIWKRQLSDAVLQALTA